MRRCGRGCDGSGHARWTRSISERRNEAVVIELRAGWQSRPLPPLWRLGASGGSGRARGQQGSTAAISPLTAPLRGGQGATKGRWTRF